MNQCKCGKGYESYYDYQCRFCRENTVSRAQAKAVGVRTAGDGMTVDQMRVLKNEIKRSEVWI